MLSPTLKFSVLAFSRVMLQHTAAMTICSKQPGLFLNQMQSTLTTTRPSFVIGVAGGSGSGKTTVTERVIRTAGAGAVCVLAQDSYYLSSDLPYDERAKINHDHPDAVDWELLLGHLDELMHGQPIYSPIYDFDNNIRSANTLAILPAPIIVLEGMLILFEPRLRQLFDLKIFVDTDSDVRFIRHMSRMVRERGHTPEAVIEHYLETVRPSHLQFVEPTKRYADVIIPHGGMNEPALEMLAARIQTIL